MSRPSKLRAASTSGGRRTVAVKNGRRTADERKQVVEECNGVVGFVDLAGDRVVQEVAESVLRVGRKLQALSARREACFAGKMKTPQ